MTFRIIIAILILIGSSTKWIFGQDLAEERIVQNFKKERQAVGPWKQVAIIESYQRSNSSDLVENVRVSGNHMVMSFLGDDRIVIADGKHPIRVFDANNGKILRSFGDPEPDSFTERKIICSLDGKYLMLLPDKNLAIWNTQTGMCVGKLPETDEEYTTAAFLPDGHSVAVYHDYKSSRTNGILEIWNFNAANSSIARYDQIMVDHDVKEIVIVGPYLLLREYNRSQVLDASSFKIILSQKIDTNERFLSLDSLDGKVPGKYTSLVLANGDGGAANTKIEFRMLALPDGHEIRRWRCPIEENSSDDRFQAFYFVSPKRQVIAISLRGTVSFFRLNDGSKVATIKVKRQLENQIRFIDEDIVLIPSNEDVVETQIIRISTGQQIARIPEQSACVSSDFQHILAIRNGVVLNGFHILESRPLVVLWKQTDH